MRNQDLPRAPSGALWAWVPVLLLGSMFIGLGGATYLAINDPGFALEPNYYDKAVHWDRDQAEARASDALGLQVVLLPLVTSAFGRANVELRIQDGQGLALAGATVQVVAFPNAYASQVQEVVLRESSPGVYTGELAHAVRGLWELRVSASQGSRRFREVLRRDVTKGDAA